MRGSLLLAAVCAALTSAPAAGQSIVTTQLDSASVMATSAGYKDGGVRFEGALDEEDSVVHQVDVSAGVSYMIVGVCDFDCSDLDLVLEDASGNEVDSDLLLDDAPVVTADVTQAGRYSVRVDMATCTVEPCAYGVAVFFR